VISHEALRAVLAQPHDARYWAIRWQYLKGDGFFDDLLRAAAHADADNLRLIGLGFPELVAGVRAWKNVPDWSAETEAWAESLVGSEARP
jgi:hypothetical protein